MIRRKSCQIIHFAIDNDPAVVWRGMFVDFGNRDLRTRGHCGIVDCEGFRLTKDTVASSMCSPGSMFSRNNAWCKAIHRLGNKTADLKKDESWLASITSPRLRT